MSAESGAHKVGIWKILTAMVIRSHLLFLYAFAQAQLSLSIVANRTIDDLHGDSTTGVVPVYEGGWNVVVVGIWCSNGPVFLFLILG
jgi:hypothetical protein